MAAHLTRRRVVATGAALGASPFWAPASGAADSPYAPVQVQPDRVVRTVVGLRPYRPSGFVLRRERLGRKTVVHNYGHGGCGVTLSWGCAAKAAQLAADADGRRAAVVGAGVMGLTTALLLLRQGYEVTVYGAELPPNTTSNIAGAFWQPSTLYDPAKVDAPFLTLFRQVARASHRAFLQFVNNDRYAVWWIRLLELGAGFDAAGERPEGNDLYPGMAAIEDPGRYFGYKSVVRYRSLMIDPDIYLAALMRDIETAGGRIVQRRFDRLENVLDLRCDVLINCTGLGAGALFGDEERSPVSGQLTHLLPQPEIDYGYVDIKDGQELYLLPRRGALLLGGTRKYGDASTEADPAERQRMLAGHAEIRKRMS